MQADFYEFIAIVWTVREHAGEAISSLLAQTGDEEFLLVGKLIEPQEAEEAQVKDEQPSSRHSDENLCRKAFVIGGGLLSIELPQGAMGKGFDHGHHPACERPGLRLQCLRLFA